MKTTSTSVGAMSERRSGTSETRGRRPRPSAYAWPVIATFAALGALVASVSATGCGTADNKQTAKGPPRLPDGGLLEPTAPASNGEVECKWESSSRSRRRSRPRRRA